MTTTTTTTTSAPGTPPTPTLSGRALGTRLRLMVADAAAASTALAAVSVVRVPGSDGLMAAAFVLVAYALWFGRGRLYRARVITRRIDELGRIVDAGLATGASVAAAAFILDLDIDQLWLVGSVAASIVALTVEREVARRLFDARRADGRMARRVLLIGDNAEADRFGALFADEPELGYVEAGRVDPAMTDDPNELTTEVLAAARHGNAQSAIVAATAIDTASSNRLIRDLVEAGIHVEVTSTLADIAADRLTVRPLGRFPVVYIEPRHRHGWRAGAKRLFDITVAGLALLAASPALVAIAVAIRRTSPGPILFRQERVGRNGVPFEVLKFRTMVVNAEELLAELSTDNEGAGPLFKMKDDPRITAIGSFLRKTSLDELPQLWNVMRGEMSLVGPRPALQSEMTGWTHDLYGRLRVKPGITGMWQVSGRSSTTFEEYTRLDLYYVDNWSLVVDLAILAKTIPAVLRSDGAY